MFVIGPNRKELENKRGLVVSVYTSALFGKSGTNMFVLTYSHLCFKVGFPLSVSFREKQSLVCHCTNVTIKGAVCRTKNRPAIQLCYPAVSCLRQVANSFLPGRLGQVQDSRNTEQYAMGVPPLSRVIRHQSSNQC